jgi:dephospho-CoA kinase
MFHWTCRGGLDEHIQTIVNQFKEYRGLKSVKLFITGPPASGKSFYGARIAQYYNIPHLHVKQLIADCCASNTDLSAQIKTYLVEEKARLVKVALEAFEKEKKKKKNLEPPNEDLILARLTDEHVVKIF